MELVIDALAAGGDGVGRDDDGRVTFVPATAPGDRARVQLGRVTSSYAHAELVEVIAPGPSRVAPVCPQVARGCGGCAWQHVARGAQLAAKQGFVERGLRALAGLRVHPVDDPCPPLGWRRRARFHVRGGEVGLYARASHRLVVVDGCPQLEPALAAAYAEVVAARPPDGELAMLVNDRGEVAVATMATWPAAKALVGRGGIVATGGDDIDLDGGRATAFDFAQASTAGNAAIRSRAVAAVGAPPTAGAVLLELHAGGGNLTRGYRAAGWRVVASDLATRAELVGDAADVLAAQAGPFAAIALDPPRTGAADAMPGVIRHAPDVVVYVACDVATLARDAARLVAAGYRATDAWPIDAMPQTAHVEVVLRLVRDSVAAP